MITYTYTIISVYIIIIITVHIIVDYLMITHTYTIIIEYIIVDYVCTYKLIIQFQYHMENFVRINKRITQCTYILHLYVHNRCNWI